MPGLYRALSLTIVVLRNIVSLDVIDLPSLLEPDLAIFQGLQRKPKFQKRSSLYFFACFFVQDPISGIPLLS